HLPYAASEESYDYTGQYRLNISGGLLKSDKSARKHPRLRVIKLRSADRWHAVIKTKKQAENF
ncbi:hypothetical protein QMS73_21325, partial [Cronobacter sakazakii]|nr:hypothetical protein [Cronobacter sakazakii]